MAVLPQWISFIVNLVFAVFLIGILLAKSTSSDATILLSLMLITYLGIGYEIGRSNRANIGGHLDTARQLLTIRAKLGDKSALEEYEQFEEVKKTYNSESKVFIANATVTFLLSLFLVIVIMFTDTY